MLNGWPLIRRRWAQDFESLSVVDSFTKSERPWPPRPSP